MPSLEEVRKQVIFCGYKKKKFLESDVISDLPNILQSNERIEQIAYALIKKELIGGILVATDNRLIFVGKSNAGLKVEDFPYNKISIIRYKSGGAMGVITLFISLKEVHFSCDSQKTRALAEYVHSKLTNATPLIDENPNAGKSLSKWSVLMILIVALLVYGIFGIDRDKTQSAQGKSYEAEQIVKQRPILSTNQRPIFSTFSVF